jgi:hypothetical protein
MPYKINANDPWDLSGLYGITPLGLKVLMEVCGGGQFNKAKLISLIHKVLPMF